jgi:hypothetical protein
MRAALFLHVFVGGFMVTNSSLLPEKHIESLDFDA